MMNRDESALSKFDPAYRKISATREALLGGDLSAFCYVHFATHGAADSSWPDSSSLILSRSNTNQRVYAFEIAELSFSARIAFLAACESGAGEVRGEGYFGLPAAFLGAGAQSVVATLWPVDSVATSEFSELFYSNLAGTNDVLQAFTLTQRRLRSLPGRSAPALWAGFVLIGAS